jgi:hypothetical protein
MHQVIKAVIWAVEKPLSPIKGTLWASECDWNDKHYYAESRTGASNQLCRQLLADGCPDLSMDLYYEGRKALIIKSIRRYATKTYEESPSVPLREKDWEPYTGKDLSE